MKVRPSIGTAVAALSLIMIPLTGTAAAAAPQAVAPPASSGTTVTTTVAPLTAAQCDLVKTENPASSCQEVITSGVGPAQLAKASEKIQSTTAAAAATYCRDIWQTRADKDGGYVWKFRHEARVCWDGTRARAEGKTQRCFVEYTIYSYKELQCDGTSVSGSSYKYTNRFQQSIKVSAFEPSATWTQTMTVDKNGTPKYYSN